MRVNTLVLPQTRELFHGHERLAGAQVSGESHRTLAPIEVGYRRDHGLALGLGSGYLLLQLLIVPRLPRFEAISTAAFFAERYGGLAPRIFSSVVVVVSMGAPTRQSRAMKRKRTAVIPWTRNIFSHRDRSTSHS